MWSLVDSKGEMNFFRARDEYVPTLNQRGALGYSDWRIPTIEEASSICNVGALSNSFRGAGPSAWFWTIDLSAEDPNIPARMPSGGTGLFNFLFTGKDSNGSVWAISSSGTLGLVHNSNQLTSGCVELSVRLCF
jgi:hypothetical protein